jgi:integrase
VCDLLTEESKNLATVPRQETAQREGTLANANIKGKVIDHLWWLRQEGYSEDTINGRSQILKQLEKAKVDLTNPEAVRDYIAKQNWTPGRRANIIYAYALFAKWAGMKFVLPRINIPEKLPFIPAEREIDDLIAACTKYIATFLQLCKETGARCGEIAQLKWTDIDYENTTVRISPEKGSNPRLCKLSGKAIQMLNQIPRTYPTIFIGHYRNSLNLRRSFQKQRKGIAAKMGNPRLMQIHFHTLRHWKGTMEYHRTKDILHVMQVLGHRRIQNTLKYTQLVHFDAPDAYICKIAKTEQEIGALIESGFEYIC